MNKFIIGIIVILISLLVVGVALSSLANEETTKDTTPPLQWGTDLNQTIQQAKSTNKSIFVDFYADWCAYCKEMDEVTYTDPQVKEKLTQNYVLLKVDVDENPDVSSKYQAYGLPTMLILDSNGNEVTRISGFQSPEQLLTQI
jgi:thioredoxin 1